ncbi:class II aldolase/adducin family protein [bacterium]|nr:class II aldolase/adducin family protein [bacterium]
MTKEVQLKEEIIKIGKKLYDFRLVAAKGGNLSARIEGNLILITSSGTCLGELREEDVLKVDLSSEAGEKVSGLTTEFPLHSLIYKNFPMQRIIHCHPPLVNAYYAVYDELENITFENKLFLGKVPQVTQTTPSVTQPEKVIEALKTNNIVVIRNHGIVSMADRFDDAFYLIEELEEAVKMAGLARLFAKKRPNKFEQELKKSLRRTGKIYPMFTREHILAIVDLINEDEKFLTKAKELNLTAQVVIKIDEEKDKAYKFNFRKGKIIKVEYNDDAPFVISGPADVWRLIFEGKLDPFVATTQGKLKLKGDLGRLSRWYVPFSRMFSLFKEMRIE